MHKLYFLALVFIFILSGCGGGESEFEKVNNKNIAQDSNIKFHNENIINFSRVLNMQSGSDIEIIKKRVLQYLVGDVGSGQTTWKQGSVQRVNLILSTIVLDESKELAVWPNLDYKNIKKVDDATKHLSNIKELALAYSSPMHQFYKNENIRKNILYGLNSWASGIGIFSSWWSIIIFAPQTIGEILILLNEDLILSDSTKFSLLSMMNKAIYDVDPISFLGLHDTSWSGNALDRIYANILMYLYINDSNLLKDVVHNKYQALLYPDDTVSGIQSDFSFHQHGQQLYTAAYGGIYHLAPSIAGFFEGTQFQINENSKRLLVDYLLDGVVMQLRGRYYNPATYGRSIILSTDRTFDENWIASVLNIAGDHRIQELSILRNSLSESDLSLSGASLNWPDFGYRYLWRSDAAVYHHKNFSMFIKSQSTGTTLNESGIGRYMSDGTAFIMKRGTEYSRIAPLWNWYSLPGITSELGSYSLNQNYYSVMDWRQGYSLISGGAGFDKVGVMGFRHDRFGVGANKSWSFFDDCAVAVGTDITAENGVNNTVRTSVNQQLLFTDVSYGSRTGSIGNIKLINNNVSLQRYPLKWVQHDDLLYLFPDADSKINISLEKRPGDWSKVNAAYNFFRPGDIFDLSIDHGTRPKNSSYSYIVTIPKSSKSENSSACSSLKIEQRDSTAHTYSFDQKSATAIIWKNSVNKIDFKDGPVSSVTSSSQAAVAVSAQSTGHRVDISDISRLKSGDLQIDIYLRSFSPNGWSNLQNSKAESSVTSIKRVEIYPGGRVSVTIDRSVELQRPVSIFLF